MPTEEQMERLILLLDTHKNKTLKPKAPKKKMIVQDLNDEDIPVKKTSVKKPTKKEQEAEKEREIKEKMEQYLKPPTKKKPQTAPEPAPASQEATEPAPQEQPKMPDIPAPQPASAQPVPAQPKASEVQTITTIISEIKSAIQPEIDTFKINQINSFIKSYRNRHI